MNHKLFLLLLPFAIACNDDVTGPAPITPLYQCRSASSGYDLSFVDLDVSGTNRDSQTGMLILNPDSIPVHYLIRNTGCKASPEGTITLEVGPVYENYLIPAMQPGEQYGDTVVLAGDFTTADLKDDRVHVHGTSWMSDSENPSSNYEAHSQIFHVASPPIDLQYTLNPSTVRAGDVVTLDITARNYGRHAAAAPITLTSCLYSGFTGCRPGHRTRAGTFQTQSVPAGAVVRFKATIQIPPTAAWQDAVDFYSMYLCKSAGTSLPLYMEEDQYNCFRLPRQIWVEPNYEAVCAPPDITSGSSVKVPSYNCGLVPGPVNPALPEHRFHIVSFNAKAGQAYELQRSDRSAVVRAYSPAGWPITDRDTSPDRVRFDEAQRVYLVMYSATSVLDVQLVEVPS